MPKRTSFKSPVVGRLHFYQKKVRSGCVFCGSDNPTKVYGEGCLLSKDGKRMVWKYRGIVHEACADRAKEEKRRALGLA